MEQRSNPNAAGFYIIDKDHVELFNDNAMWLFVKVSGNSQGKFHCAVYVRSDA